MTFFLISSMILSLLNQQISLQLYLIQLLGFLIGLGLLELWHLMYPRLLTEFGHFHKLKSYVISGQIFGPILYLSNSRPWVVLDEKFSQEYPVNAEVPWPPFLILHFFYYTLMTFLKMLFVALLSILMILLSTLLMLYWYCWCKNG